MMMESPCWGSFRKRPEMFSGEAQQHLQVRVLPAEGSALPHCLCAGAILGELRVCPKEGRQGVPLGLLEVGLQEVPHLAPIELSQLGKLEAVGRSHPPFKLGEGSAREP
jgi:hypothetical protein